MLPSNLSQQGIVLAPAAMDPRLPDSVLRGGFALAAPSRRGSRFHVPTALRRRLASRSPKEATMQIAIKRSVLSVALAFAGASAQAADWTVKDLGTFGGTTSIATGINASGQVVGSAYTATAGNVQHAFISAPNGGVLTDLGTLGGTYSQATGINASGQVVGIATTAGNAQHAFISAPNGGALTDLGTLGGTSSQATGINASGQVVGTSYTANGPQHAFISAPNGGALTDLGTFVGQWFSEARGINASGQVVGRGDRAGGFYVHAFISAPNGGALTDLGTFGGFHSEASGINASGQVVGSAHTAGGAQHAFISAPNGGALTDLGTLGGSLSQASGINASGQVVGIAYTAGDAQQHAFISAPNGGALFDLSILAAAGRDLNFAAAINDYGQVAGTDADDHAFLATPNAKWGAGGNGSWDNAANWNFGGMGAVGFTPGAPHDVVINPAGSATVLGSTNATMNSLLVAGNSSHIVTLNLNGGSTTARNGTSVNPNGVLAGNGLLVGGLNVSAGGRVNVGAGESMLLAGGTVSNSGVIGVLGSSANPSSLEIGGPAKNFAGGQINVQNANVSFLGGLANFGQLNTTFGVSNIAGNIDNRAGGKVIVSNGASASFYDGVINNGELRVSAGGAANFFGLVSGAGSFTGTGEVRYEGGFKPGNSPAQVTIDTVTVFSSTSPIWMELGGLTVGSEYDKITFTNSVTLQGGDLNVLWYNSWTGHAGESYDLFDWGTGLAGNFGYVNLATLDKGLMWNTSNLYTSGVISISGVPAVPEPGTYAMMLAGLGLLGFMARRRKQNAAA
jgi:probable HAF family extracellular repeat protein